MNFLLMVKRKYFCTNEYENSFKFSSIKKNFYILILANIWIGIKLCLLCSLYSLNKIWSNSFFLFFVIQIYGFFRLFIEKTDFPSSFSGIFHNRTKNLNCWQNDKKQSELRAEQHLDKRIQKIGRILLRVFPPSFE